MAPKHSKPAPDDFETLAPAASSFETLAPAASRPVALALPQGDTATDSPPDAKKRAGRGLSLKARAVNYLSRREHSRQELARKLAPHVPPEQPDVLEALLDELERENWLSNQRFAHSTAHRRGAGRGTALVMQELRQHSLDAADLETVRDQLRGTEQQRAREAWQKKFGQPPEDAKTYAKQARFMASRGFSNETFRRVLAEHGIEED